MFCPTCFQKVEVELQSEVALDVEQLPRVLQEIASLVGPENAVKIARAYGGVRLYVPRRMKPDHPLAELVGFENARALSTAFGGLPHFDIPQVYRLLLEARNRAILKDRSQGMSVRELALKYRLTEKHVHNIQKTALKVDLAARLSQETLTTTNLSKDDPHDR
ncbi:Mor transcription activator family protein [Methylocaldum gracile subsp. desertum]|uniref:Mor transcription activator family protein n=1 Tax=Methylocaldum sp. GT1BW TaxID=3438964 RepID=UPI003DA0EA9F